MDKGILTMRHCFENGDFFFNDTDTVTASCAGPCRTCNYVLVSATTNCHGRRVSRLNGLSEDVYRASLASIFVMLVQRLASNIHATYI